METELAALAKKTYGIIGLGLMGGSFAIALRDEVLGGGQIFALDAKPAALAHAQESGIIDGGYAPAQAPALLARCDIVFICLYPRQTLDFLRQNKAAFKAGALVCDISGVKGFLDTQLDAICNGAQFDFVSTHPMAGSEKEGFLHATAALFRGRNFIVLPAPRNKPKNLALVIALARKIGFSRITQTDAATHDHKIAFTSQLCHVIACALVDSAEDARVTEFGGGSFEDLTRIAMINAPLWTELLISNKTELSAHIEAFERALDTLKTLITTQNSTALCAALSRTREKRIDMAK